MREKYINELENLVKQFIKPIKDVPYHLVIESLTGTKITHFDKIKNKDLLLSLQNMANSVCKKVNNEGLKSKRVNEVGNKIEKFVKQALIENGYQDADTPTMANGKKKSAGCPDLLFTNHDGNKIYLECKSFNNANRDTSFRSFYLSFAENNKIIYDAYHLLIAFEVETTTNEARKMQEDEYITYKINGWKLCNLQNLKLNLKQEFNASNKDLYNKANILIEENLTEDNSNNNSNNSLNNGL